MKMFTIVKFGKATITFLLFKRYILVIWGHFKFSWQLVFIYTLIGHHSLTSLSQHLCCNDVLWVCYFCECQVFHSDQQEFK